jgi:hypothetical protein
VLLEPTLPFKAQLEQLEVKVLLALQDLQEAWALLELREVQVAKVLLVQPV